MPLLSDVHPRYCLKVQKAYLAMDLRKPTDDAQQTADSSAVPATVSSPSKMNPPIAPAFHTVHDSDRLNPCVRHELLLIETACQENVFLFQTIVD